MIVELKVGDKVEVVNSQVRAYLLTHGLPFVGEVRTACGVLVTVRIEQADGSYMFTWPNIFLRLVPENNTFNSQQEIWEYLIAGGKVVSQYGNVYGLIDGTAKCVIVKEAFSVSEVPLFTKPGLFIKYQEPVVLNWYDNIPKQGLLCRTKQREDSLPSYNIIYKYEKDTSYPFRTKKGGFRFATPVTQEEASVVIYQPTLEK